MTKKRAFIVERPLQILIALAIIKQMDGNFDNHILIANCFQNAHFVANTLKSASVFKNTKFYLFDNYDQAFYFAKNNVYEEFLIHWDVGFRTNFRLRGLKIKDPSTKIFVFEEGIGTYRDNIFSGLKKFLFKKIGVATNCGGHDTVEKIFLYAPSEYEKKVTKPAPEAVQIILKISDVIDIYSEVIVQAFDGNHFLKSIKKHKQKECLIYMSDWKFKESDLDFIEKSESVKILKLHPHVMSRRDLIRDDFLIAPNELPAELLIARAQVQYQNIIVLHHGSSVTNYICSENIRFLDIRKLRS